MQKPLSIRPTEETEEKLEKLIEIEKMEKSVLIRKLLNIGVDKELKNCALKLFKENRVTLAKAAEIADVSVREMMDLIQDSELSLHISAEDIQRDFEEAMR
jgi:predicted HTH domain antitoxin